MTLKFKYWNDGKVRAGEEIVRKNAPPLFVEKGVGRTEEEAEKDAERRCNASTKKSNSV